MVITSLRAYGIRTALREVTQLVTLLLITIKPPLSAGHTASMQ
jgi:hypothetical protein